MASRDDDKKEKVGEVLLRNVRISFANLDRPYKDPKNKDPNAVGKYGCRGLIYDDDPDADDNIRAMEDAIDDVIYNKWGNNPPKIKKDKLCLRDGNDEDIDGYQGAMYVAASSDDQPELITKFKDDDGHWEKARVGQIYSGCYGNMLVQVWAQDNEYGKRVNARLKAVQFVKKGDAFGNSGPVDVDEAFSSIEAERGEDMDRRGRGRGRDSDDEDRGDRRSRDRDRGDRDRDRDDDRRSSRGRDREDDRDRGRGRGRDDDDRRGDRSRDRDSGRDRDRDRGSRDDREDRRDDRSRGSRDRDDDRERDRDRERGRDRDEDRGRDRGRDRDDDRDDRGRGRSRDDRYSAV